jgi:hypothetical protein
MTKTTCVVSNPLLVPPDWHAKWWSKVNRSSPQFNPKALKIHNDIHSVLDDMKELIVRAKRGEYKNKGIQCKVRYEGRRPRVIGDDMYALLCGVSQNHKPSLVCLAEEVNYVLFNHEANEQGAQAISLGIVAEYLDGWSDLQPSRAISTLINGCMNDISFIERDPEGMTREVELHTDHWHIQTEWYEMCETIADVIDHQARQNDEAFKYMRELLSGDMVADAVNNVKSDMLNN